MTRPNLPAELDLLAGKQGYSLRTDLRVNGWGYVAMALSFTGDVLLARHREWPNILRTAIALAPVVPAVLWGRVFARWVRGMDEMHRRLTVEACLMATTATLFFFTALHPLGKAGILEGFAERTGLDMRTWWGTSWLLVCFYILGTRVLRRRYE